VNNEGRWTFIFVALQTANQLLHGEHLNLEQETTTIPSMKHFLLLSGFLMIAVGASAQGAIDGFLKSQGELDMALGYSRDKASTYLLATGPLASNRDAKSISLFANYGLHKYLNVIVNAPLVNWTPQDGSLYLKSGLSKQLGSWKLTGIAALGYTFPLSDYQTESGSAIGQQTEAVNIRGLIQVEPIPGWFGQFRMGYDAAKEPVISSSIWSVKAGFFKGKWYGDLWYEEREAEGGKNYRGTGADKPSSFRELGVDLQRAGGVIYYQWKPQWGGFVSGAYVLDGRNTYQNRTVGVGVVWKAKLN
jgi:hypothetical protein